MQNFSLVPISKILFVNSSFGIHILFIFSVMIMGCLKVESPPKSNASLPPNIYSNTYGCYQYWPKRQNKKWIFEVSKDSSGFQRFLYLDTLEYEKDTNILMDGFQYFSIFKFKKSPYNFRFIIGNYFQNKLSYYLYGVTYVAFDLDSIKKNINRIYSYNRFPFDYRFTVSYKSPFIEDYSTAIGKFQVISSNVKYEWTSTTGNKVTYNKQMYLAKDIGLVYFMYNYKSFNNLNVKDSALSLIFDIKKVLH